MFFDTMFCSETVDDHIAQQATQNGEYWFEKELLKTAEIIAKTDGSKRLSQDRSLLETATSEVIKMHYMTSPSHRYLGLGARDS